MAIKRLGSDLGEAKAGKWDRLQPSGKRFGRLTEQLRRGAAKDEKPGRQGLSVSQHPKGRKEIGPALHLVNHHHTGETPEGGHRLPPPPPGPTALPRAEDVTINTEK